MKKLFTLIVAIIAFLGSMQQLSAQYNGTAATPSTSTTASPVYYYIESASNGTVSTNSFTGDFTGRVMIGKASNAKARHYYLTTANIDSAQWAIVTDIGSTPLLKNKATGLYLTGSHTTNSTPASTTNTFNYAVITGSQYKMWTADGTAIPVSVTIAWKNNLLDRWSPDQGANSLTAWYFVPASSTTLYQTITFPAIAPIALTNIGIDDFSPAATCSSGNAVTYASSNTAVATIVSGKIHIVGSGATTITASVAASSPWAAATDVTQKLTVVPFSTASTENWCYIQFATGSAVLADQGVGNKILTEAKVAGKAKQLWKIEEVSSGSGTFILTSMLGNKINFAASRYTTNTTGIPLSFDKSTNPSNLTKLEIRRSATAASGNHMNQNGGAGAGRELGEYGLGDPNNPLTIIPAANAKELLQMKIASATSWYSQSTEGTNQGQYPTGTRSTLNSAISTAQGVYDNVASVDANYTTATTNLQTALTTFRFALRLFVLSPADGSADVWYFIQNQRNWTAAYPTNATGYAMGGVAVGTTIPIASPTYNAMNNLYDKTAQQWKIVESATTPGDYQLINRSTGKSIAANFTANEPSAGVYWHFQLPTSPGAFPGVRIISGTSGTPGQVMHGNGSLLVAQYDMQAAECYWVFTPEASLPHPTNPIQVSNGSSTTWYALKNYSVGTYLQDNGLTQTLNLGTLAGNNDKYLWKVYDNADGTYSMISKLNSGYITVPAGESTAIPLTATRQNWTINYFGSNQFAIEGNNGGARRLHVNSSLMSYVAAGISSASAWYFESANAVPATPTAVVATAGNAQASVAITIPAASTTVGSASITGYTVTSSPGGFTATGTSPVIVTGLANGTAYTFTAVANSTVGSSAASAASNSISPVPAPDAPTSVVATRGNAQASVEFTTPVSDGGSPIIDYTVTSSPDSFTATGASSPLTVTGLTNGTAYTFTVTARSLYGSSIPSAASAAVTPATVPGIPTLGKVYSADGQAMINFTAPAANGGTAITSYTATSSPGGITATLSQAGDGAITVNGLTNGTAYTFTITATNAVGTSAASATSTSVTPNPIPAFEYSDATKTIWYTIKNASGRGGRDYITDNGMDVSLTGEVIIPADDKFLWKLVENGNGTVGVISKKNSGYLEVLTATYAQSQLRSVAQALTLTDLGFGQFNIKNIGGIQLHLQGDYTLVPWSGGINSGSAWMFNKVKTTISGTVSVSSLGATTGTDITVTGAGNILTIDQNSTVNSITVNPGAALTLSNGKVLTAGALKLESDESGTATFVDQNTASGLTVSGATTVQQYLPALATRTWWYLASPVTGATSTVFGANQVGAYSEVTSTYSAPFGSATSLTAGKGYVVKMNATEAATAKAYSFAGALNNANVTVNLTRTGISAVKRGFNLVGNPYPSYLNWGAAYTAASNVRPTIWYRTGSGTTMEFHTYNANLQVGTPATATQYIPPMQAFWVKVDTDPASEGETSNGTLNLTNAMRSHDESTSGNPLKVRAVNENQIIRLSVSNGTVADETVIATHPSASDNFDLYDSEKMSNSDVNRPEIYSMVGNQELVINGVSELVDGSQFALGLRPGVAGNYSIALTEWSNPSDMELVLRDNSKTVNTDWVLTSESPYSFISTDAVDNTRFSLLFRSKGSVTGFTQLSSNLLVYAVQGAISVESADLKGAKVTVFNTLGQPMFDAKAQSNKLTIGQSLSAGVYIVKVNNELRKVSVK